MIYTIEETAQAIIHLLDSWAVQTDDDRLYVLDMVKDKVCIDCGRLTPNSETCHCMNDE